MNMMHGFFSTRLAWRVGALLTLTLALLLLPAVALAQSPPAAPDTVTATHSTNNGSDSLAVSWSAVEGADGYHVNISGNDKRAWTRILSDVSGTSATIDKNLNSGVTYYVAVAAVKSGVTGGWTNSAAVPPLNPPPSPPGTPSSVTLTRADGSVSADWPDMSGATKYHVTYSTDNRKSWSLATTERPYSHITINGADNGKTYIVAVRAGNAAGWSGWVNSPAAGPYTPEPTPTPEPTAIPVPAPARPTGLSATAGDGSVTLTWNDQADSSITGYEYRTRWAGVAWGAWTAIASGDADTTSHTVTGLTNGTEYRFKLRAVNAGGVSKPAPQSSPWYAAATPQVPPQSAPTNVTVSVSVNVMTVSWNAVSGADGYDVRTKTGSADWVIVASNVSGTTTDVTILEIPDYTGVRASGRGTAMP